jgi:ABC-type lipopolysaccharide export system ATPase subunit
MVLGALLVQGSPQAIAADSRVREVYLGEADHG